jgi:hypothetical protein
VEVLELVGDGVGAGDADATGFVDDVGWVVGVGVGDGVPVAGVLAEVGVAVGAAVEPLGTGLGDATKPDGAAVGLSGLLAVTFPPPDEQEAAATTAVPATNASISCLYIEHSKTMLRPSSASSVTESNVDDRVGGEGVEGNLDVSRDGAGRHRRIGLGVDRET